MVDAAAALAEGIAAAKAGNREQARTLLTQVVQLDERNEQAWLWLSSVLDSSDDVMTCLENVLVINPTNHWAREALEIVRVRRVLEESRPVMPTSTAQSPQIARRLGACLVELGILTEDKLQRTLEQQEAMRRQGQHMPLGQLLLRNGIITRDQLARALEQQFTATGSTGTAKSAIGQLGDYLIRHRYISWSQLAQAIALQAELAHQGRPMRLGELLVKNRFLTRDQLTQALEEQFQDFHTRFGGHA
jgi:hypothetical protein